MQAAAKKNNFGKRLILLRKAAGYTQTELGNEIGVTRRTIAYYEREAQQPPAGLLADLAKVLGLSIDELLGLNTAPKLNKPVRSRLQKRLQEIEKLDPKEKRQVLQIIDSFIERQKLKQQTA